jgi:hypothetical protein
VGLTKTTTTTTTTTTTPTLYNIAGIVVKISNNSILIGDEEKGWYNSTTSSIYPIILNVTNGTVVVLFGAS